MTGLGDYVDSVKQRRRDDAKRFEELDGNLCMLCHARGGDMRSFIVSSGYNMGEVVGEMIDLHEVEGNLNGRGWYLRTCKSCRGALLTAIMEAAAACREKRKFEVDSDGAVITREVKIDRETGQPVEA